MGEQLTDADRDALLAMTSDMDVVHYVNGLLAEAHAAGVAAGRAEALAEAGDAIRAAETQFRQATASAQLDSIISRVYQDSARVVAGIGVGR